MRSLDLPSVEVTEALMAGALKAALGNPVAPVLDLPRYILVLCRCYHTTGATPENLEIAARGFTAIADHRAALSAIRQARDEIGHDVLALKDLASLGVPKGVPDAIGPANAFRLVALLERLVRAPRPYGVFGYAYVLEALTAQLTADHLREIQRLVPPGIDITRCLRVHSVADQKHLRALIQTVTDCDQEGRELVMAAILETAALIVEGVDDQDGVARLTSHLERTGWTPPVALETAS